MKRKTIGGRSGDRFASLARRLHQLQVLMVTIVAVILLLMVIKPL